MTYLVFIRGINVGGKNIVKMSMLIKELSNIGFDQVKSYIQSGNLILKTDLAKSEIQNKIEALLLQKFSVNTDVILRRLDEVDKLLKECPYPIEDSSSKVKKLYLYFLTNPLDKEDFDKLQKHVNPSNKYFASNENLYLYCDEGISASKLATNIAKPDTGYTSRNWDTVCAVAKMASIMNEE